MTPVLITEAHNLLLTTARTAYTTYEAAQTKAIDFVVPLILIANDLNVTPRSKTVKSDQPVTSEAFRTQYIINGLGCKGESYPKELAAIATSPVIRALITSDILKLTDDAKRVTALKKVCVSKNLQTLKQFNNFKKKAGGPNQKSNADLASLPSTELAKAMDKKASNIDDSEVIKQKIRILKAELKALEARLLGMQVPVSPKPVLKTEAKPNKVMTSKRTSQPATVKRRAA